MSKSPAPASSGAFTSVSSTRSQATVSCIPSVHFCVSSFPGGGAHSKFSRFNVYTMKTALKRGLDWRLEQWGRGTRSRPCALVSCRVLEPPCLSTVQSPRRGVHAPPGTKQPRAAREPMRHAARQRSSIRTDELGREGQHAPVLVF